MPKVSYVYPNLSQFHHRKTAQRGGLVERWELARKTGCTYIEVPGTLIKNLTEEKRTGLEIGDFLSRKEIELFYKRDDQLPENLRYVLHTDPSLSKPNRNRRKVQPEIKWHDREWTQRHVEMIISICRYLKKPAEIIEIHPGDKGNTYSGIANAITMLLESYFEEFRFYPLVLLENRTRQLVSRGRDIKEYWKYIDRNNSELVEHTGIVLDVQQLYKSTDSNFLKEYDEVPSDSLKGFHIHSGDKKAHKQPHLRDRIPWRCVFGKIRELEGDILINPEIYKRDHVEQTIRFCENLLHES